MKREYIEAREKNARKLDRKSLPLFIGIMVLCLGGGFIIGYLISGIGDTKAFTEALSTAMCWFCPAALVIGTVSAAIWSFTVLKRLNADVRAWDGENEETADTAEMGLSRVVFVTNLLMVVNFGLFGIAGYVLKIAEMYAVMIACAAVFMAGMGVIIIAQNRAVKLEQLICPEKNGSLFAPNFVKNTVASLDEAEKLVLYRAGYAAHKAVSATCMLLWIVAILVQYVFECGVMPVVMVTAIWFADVFAFCAAQKGNKA